MRRREGKVNFKKKQEHNTQRNPSNQALRFRQQFTLVLILYSSHFFLMLCIGIVLGRQIRGQGPVQQALNHMPKFKYVRSPTDFNRTTYILKIRHLLKYLDKLEPLSWGAI